MISQIIKKRFLKIEIQDLKMKKKLNLVLTLLPAFFLIGSFSTFIEIFLPILKHHFNINYATLSLFDTAFFITYAFMSVIIAFVVDKVGLKKGFIMALCILIISCVNWGILFRLNNASIYYFLINTFIMAVGVVVLFIICEYVGLFYSNKKDTGKLSMFQSMHSLGAFLTPFVISTIIYSKSEINHKSFENLSNLSFIFIIFIILSIVLMTRVKYINTPQLRSKLDKSSSSNWNAERFYKWLALFLYVGVEVTLATFLMNQAITKFEVSPSFGAKLFITYWLLMIVGRFIGGFLIAPNNEKKLVFIMCSINIILVGFSVFSYSIWGLLALTATGLCNAILFPLLFSLGFQNKETLNIKQSGVMATAISGGAIVPLLTGLLADTFSLNSSLCLSIICYLLIIFLQRSLPKTS